MITVLRGCVGAISSAAVIRVLQDHGVRVVGMDSDPHSVGFHLCDASHVVPAPTALNYIDCILNVCQKERVDAILPSAEEEILLLAASRERLTSRHIKLLSPWLGACGTCADKRLADRYFRQAGIPTPQLYLRDPLFPCVVKPPMGRGGEGFAIVENEAELTIRLSRDPTLLVQEHIDGDLWGLDVLADWDSTVLSLVTRQKYLMQAGSMTKGITRRDDEAMEYVRRIVHDLRLVGPVIIEYIRDTRGPHFIDINTRFGGGGGALSIAADPSIIPNLIRMIKGEPTVPSNGFVEGLGMLTHYTEVFTEMKGTVTEH